jgi:hypothetical protein
LNLSTVVGVSSSIVVPLITWGSVSQIPKHFTTFEVEDLYVSVSQTNSQVLVVLIEAQGKYILSIAL